MGDTTTTTLTQPLGPDGSDIDDSEPRTFLGLSLSQIAGSALAAVTTAVAASFLGVAGTLIGAAFGSVVSTVAGAAYATSLKTAATRVRTTRTVLVRPGPDAVRGTSQTDPARVPSGFGAEPVEVTEAAGTSGLSAVTTYRSRPRVTWKPVAAVAALGFVLGIGLLSVTEGLLGHPVSGSEASGTTIGSVVGGGADTTPQPSTTPSPTATDPTASPSDGATATPSDGATTVPTDPGTTTSSTDATTATPTDGGSSSTTTDPVPPADAPTAPAAGQTAPVVP
ncbi:hypothetical protein [Kineosporia sp. A_224]|uniref:hypothetical protein n=1 Tax=Kineosporia sp. A_224 TaxID=1962180 RepID=UPI000B4B8853|nr:hypothetical protein [Kineosporia sp. A_224]